jgi:hypothetical protein
MNLKSLSIIAAIATIALAPHNAQASSYSNTPGSTQFTINELTNNIGSGNYFIQAGLTNWIGNFTAPPNSNGTTYIGNFGQSSQNSQGTPITCNGSIKLDRTLVSGEYVLSVKWMFTGGTGCPIVGPRSTVLKESLPIANASGNFTPANSTTRFVPANSRDVWPKWKVVDPMGLNCRSTPPTGVIITVFPVGTVINVTGFSSNGTWLKTSANGNPCYVRANSTYLKPVQIPF